MRNLVFLGSAQPFADFALLLMRVFVGIFLIWGVWDGWRMRRREIAYARRAWQAGRDRQQTGTG